jgi:hypothetical protein
VVAKPTPVSWGTRRGTCKGGGQSSKAKGRAAVQAVRDLLTKTFGWEPDDTLVKATSQVGEDLHLSPRARRDFPFGVEVKSVEALNIFKALEQAQHQAPDRAPIVFFKRAHTPMFVALKAEDFLRLMAPKVTS